MRKKRTLEAPSVLSPLQEGAIRSRSQLQTGGGGATESSPQGSCTRGPPSTGATAAEGSSLGVRHKNQPGKTQHIFHPGTDVASSLTIKKQTLI